MSRELPDDEPRLGWSQSDTLHVATNGAQGSGEMLSMQANFATSVLGPGDWTLEFNLLQGRQADTVYAAEAEITWSVAGNFVRRVIDVKSGATISGVAEAVSVKVKDRGQYLGPLIPWPGPPVPFDPATMIRPEMLAYVASVQATKGTRAGWEQPPVLSGPVLASIAGGGASPIIPIPQNCGVVAYYFRAGNSTGAAFDPTAVVVNQQNAIGIDVSANILGHGWLPISNNTRSIQIRNGSAVSIQPAIMWGIDG